MVTFVQNGFHFSGAGALIVEDYYKKNGTIEPCIVLVRNKASGIYSDFGGTYGAKHGDLKVTAAAELREESRNLFNINPRHLVSHVDIPAGTHKFYRAYVVKINGISRKYFKHNASLMDKMKASGQAVPRSWRETDDITHIPIKNIHMNRLGMRGTIVLKDIDNRSITLHGRAKRVIYHAQAILFNTTKMNPINKGKDMIIHQSNSWTNKTYSYVLR
jgi:hypothetical protein